MIIETQHLSLTDIHQHEAELLVILAPAGQSEFARHSYGQALTKCIQTYINSGDWHEDSKHLLCINPKELKTQRLLLVDANNDASASQARKISEAVFQVLEQIQPATTHLCMPDWLTGGEQLVHALYHRAYRFADYKTKPAKPFNGKICLLVNNEQAEDLSAYAKALHTGKCLTRDLANMPGNLCTPSYFAEQSLALEKRYPTLSTDVLDEAQLTALGMGAYMAVGRGSAQPSCMPVIRYIGAEPDQPALWIIGKGITFDTGGITLKKPPGMQNMIYDMCGGATIVGLMAAVAELKLPINVTGVIATAENMPDGDAFRPGDILTTMSGQTVEIISTDAEGRLVLCDAITYAKQHNPALIIDIATLTGAQIVSLGSHASGLMGNSPALNKALQQAGEESGDRAWTMPIWPDYQDALDSPFADMRNAGSNSPGMITAGCYLARFAGNTPWAHLDIAGTSFQYGTGNSATGRPLPLLLQFLRNYSNKTGIEWSTDMDASALLT